MAIDLLKRCVKSVLPILLAFSPTLAFGSISKSLEEYDSLATIATNAATSVDLTDSHAAIQHGIACALLAFVMENFELASVQAPTLDENQILEKAKKFAMGTVLGTCLAQSGLQILMTPQQKAEFLKKLRKVNKSLISVVNSVREKGIDGFLDAYLSTLQTQQAGDVSP